MANDDKKPKGETVAAAEQKAGEEVVAPIVVVEHKNVFEALSAFQGENPTIAKTKEFGKEGEKMHWWYAPLDGVLTIVRPLLAKHGLAITWEQGKNPGEMVAALYHSTYTVEKVVTKKSTTTIPPGTGEAVSKTVVEEVYEDVERNVIRSMPVKVKREGDMKAIGGDSTYARRYTGAEVLGIAPDEDNDILEENERLTKVEGFAFTRAKTAVTGAKTLKALEEHVAFFKKELALLEEKKPASLGFTKEQYEELMAEAEKRDKVLHGEVEPTIDITPPADEPGK